jgi:translation initiation factor 2 subunit 2
LITFATILQLTPFDPTKKKKKKKVVIQDPSDEVEKLSEKTESLTGAPNAYGKDFP